MLTTHTKNSFSGRVTYGTGRVPWWLISEIGQTDAKCHLFSSSNRKGESFRSKIIINPQPPNHNPFSLSLPAQRFLTNLKLFQNVRKQLSKSVIAHAALHYVGVFVCSAHDLHPWFVDLTETFRFLWDVTEQWGSFERLSQHTNHEVVTTLRSWGKIFDH